MSERLSCSTKSRAAGTPERGATRRGPARCDWCEVAVGDHEAAELAVVGLHAEGLVHRLDGVVFATRAVVRTHELDVVGGRPRSAVDGDQSPLRLDYSERPSADKEA